MSTLFRKGSQRAISCAEAATCSNGDTTFFSPVTILKLHKTELQVHASHRICVLWDCRENPMTTIWRKHNTDECGHQNLMRVAHKVSDPSASSWINGKLRWLSTNFHHLQLMHTVRLVGRLIFQPITRRDSCSPHGGGANRAPISKASSGGASSRRSLSFIHLRYRRLLSCSYHIPHQLQTQIRQKQIRSSFLSWAKECNCNILLHFFPSLSKAKRVPHWFWQISVRAQSMLWLSNPSNILPSFQCTLLTSRKNPNHAPNIDLPYWTAPSLVAAQIPYVHPQFLQTKN